MKRAFVKNGSSEYYIIDKCDRKLLLQRKSDGEIVVAYNYKFGSNETVLWGHGNYFGSNLVAAVQKFYGKD